MRYRIKARLAELGRTSVEVIEEIRRRGVDTSPTRFSAAIRGADRGPKAEKLCEMADQIISEWEVSRSG